MSRNKIVKRLLDELLKDRSEKESGSFILILIVESQNVILMESMPESILQVYQNRLDQQVQDVHQSSIPR
jgi:hypothetical protein